MNKSVTGRLTIQQLRLTRSQQEEKLAGRRKSRILGIITDENLEIGDQTQENNISEPGGVMSGRIMITFTKIDRKLLMMMMMCAVLSPVVLCRHQKKIHHQLGPIN